MLEINRVYHGDCLEVMKDIDDNCVDSIVTDPPYGLKFMGKKWDYGIPPIEIWQECLRILKPGGHLLSFAGSRTQHRIAVSIEDGGFEIRDCIMWIYGSGFPKSLDISKAIDKLKGEDRKIIGKKPMSYLDSNCWGIPGKNTMDKKFSSPNPTDRNKNKKISQNERNMITKPSSPEAIQWDGWGTNLKPAYEPIYLCRKPISEKTIAKNVLKWGVGGINIDDCRIEINDIESEPNYRPNYKTHKAKSRIYTGNILSKSNTRITPSLRISDKGRWPANVIHDGSDEVVELFPDKHSSGIYYKRERKIYVGNSFNESNTLRKAHIGSYNDSGSAARFFYCAKSTKKERGESNNHPTVKPLKLIEYLIELITPQNGIVLDCFAGSGTTGIAARNLNRNFILIEKELEYVKLIKKRLNEPMQTKLT